MENQLTLNDVLVLLGLKEVELNMLRNKVSQLQEELAKLQPKVES